MTDSTTHHSFVNIFLAVFAILSVCFGGWLSGYCFYKYHYFRITDAEQRGNFISLFMIGSLALSTTIVEIMALLRYIYVWNNTSFCYFRLFFEVYGRNASSMWSLSICICLYIITKQCEQGMYIVHLFLYICIFIVNILSHRTILSPLQSYSIVLYCILFYSIVSYPII